MHFSLDSPNPNKPKQHSTSQASLVTSKIYQQNLDHLRLQYVWLTDYLSPEKLNHYLELITFMNLNRSSPSRNENLQLRDVHLILTLWDLELQLEDNKISNEVLQYIDSYICTQTNGFCKRGLVSRKDIFIRKRQFFYDMVNSENHDSIPKDNSLTSLLKERVQEFLALRITPTQ